MPFIVVLKPFKFAYRGCDVQEFEPSQDPIEVSERCAEVAIAEKWAKTAKPSKQDDESAGQ